MQIASSGQSWQSLLFCSLGQQGMSADIDDMPAMWSTADAFAAAGTASGAKANPAMIDIASKRVMSRRNNMPYPDTAKPGLEVVPFHNCGMMAHTAHAE